MNTGAEESNARADVYLEMNNRDMQFDCGACKHSWKSSEYPEGDQKCAEIDNARDGYECPKCHSTDISGTDL